MWLLRQGIGGHPPPPQQKKINVYYTILVNSVFGFSFELFAL